MVQSNNARMIMLLLLNIMKTFQWLPKSKLESRSLVDSFSIVSTLGIDSQFNQYHCLQRLTVEKITYSTQLSDLRHIQELRFCLQRTLRAGLIIDNQFSFVTKRKGVV